MWQVNEKRKDSDREREEKKKLLHADRRLTGITFAKEQERDRREAGGNERPTMAGPTYIVNANCMNPKLHSNVGHGKAFKILFKSPENQMPTAFLSKIAQIETCAQWSYSHYCRGCFAPSIPFYYLKNLAIT